MGCCPLRPRELISLEDIICFYAPHQYSVREARYAITPPDYFFCHVV